MLPLCRFEGNKTIRDQVIEHASCAKVCDRLLVQSDANLTLEILEMLYRDAVLGVGHLLIL